jgi:hypothetical protein
MAFTSRGFLLVNCPNRADRFVKPLQTFRRFSAVKHQVAVAAAAKAYSIGWHAGELSGQLLQDGQRPAILLFGL